MVLSCSEVEFLSHGVFYIYRISSSGWPSRQASGACLPVSGRLTEVVSSFDLQAVQHFVIQS
jgi:hypothetical protein